MQATRSSGARVVPEVAVRFTTSWTRFPVQPMTVDLMFAAQRPVVRHAKRLAATPDRIGDEITVDLMTKACGVRYKEAKRDVSLITVLIDN